MNKQLELTAEERAISGKQVKQLRKKGIVPANMFGHNRPSMSLQVDALALRKVLAQGGKDVVLLLKVADRPSTPVLIKHVQHDVVTGSIDHIDFYMVNATEKLKTQIRLHFINEAGAASQGEVLVQRPLNEVTVECLPGDLPSSIEVDLSRLSEIDAVIRVADLPVGPGVTILTDPNEMVAAVHLRAHLETPGTAEETAGTPAPGGTAAS